MIATLPFGKTGHNSTRTLFGAAALAAMSPDRCERVLETLLEFGVNHIDTAASYGESELRLAPWMRSHRADFFLATKTGERSGAGARRSLERSLERLEVDHVDLIQMHNLVDEAGWQEAMGDKGALQALITARDEGLVRFIGVTGHGTQAPAMHLRSLEKFGFDSVLAPYNYSMMSLAAYAADFNGLERACHERNVALQTIKSIARRRWQGDGSQRKDLHHDRSHRDELPHEQAKRFSWYEPIKDTQALRRGVQWALSRSGVFLNTSSDATVLREILSAAADYDTAPSNAAMVADHDRLEITPLFQPGLDAI